MKPHLYLWDGRWWVSRNGRQSFRKGITMNDLSYYGFAWACEGAKWWVAR